MLIVVYIYVQDECKDRLSILFKYDKLALILLVGLPHVFIQAIFVE